VYSIGSNPLVFFYFVFLPLSISKQHYLRNFSFFFHLFQWIYANMDIRTNGIVHLFYIFLIFFFQFSMIVSLFSWKFFLIKSGWFPSFLFFLLKKDKFPFRVPPAFPSLNKFVFLSGFFCFRLFLVLNVSTIEHCYSQWIEEKSFFWKMCDTLLQKKREKEKESTQIYDMFR